MHAIKHHAQRSSSMMHKDQASCTKLSSDSYRNTSNQSWVSLTTNIHKYRLQTENICNDNWYTVLNGLLIINILLTYKLHWGYGYYISSVHCANVKP